MWMIIILIMLTLYLATAMMPLFIAILAVYCFYLIYEIIYFKSKAFAEIKGEIQEYIDECNELNMHIEELKNSHTSIRQRDYGFATYTDSSIYNFKRPELKKAQQSKNVYKCSLTVCKNAQQQPFKYVCTSILKVIKEYPKYIQNSYINLIVSCKN